jgi:hypothetical protein
VKLGIESAGARRGLAVLALALAGYCLHAQFGLGGKQLDGFFNDWLYNGVLVLCALACFARVLARPKDPRAAWILIGVALTMWATADIYYSVPLQHLDENPIPTIYDAFNLSFYPPA